MGLNYAGEATHQIIATDLLPQPITVFDLPLILFYPKLIALAPLLLHSLLVFDFFPIKLDFSQPVVDDGSPI